MKALARSRFQPSSSRHSGMITTKESALAARCAASSSASMCSAIRRMTSGTKGGFASKLPSRGRKRKKDPSDPKAPSVSRNAEQKRP